MSERDLDRVWCRARPRLNAACDAKPAPLTVRLAAWVLVSVVTAGNADDSEPERWEGVLATLILIVSGLVAFGFFRAWLA